MKREELVANIARKGSFLCVGLDPDIKKIPAHLLERENPLLDFCREIVDATAHYCVAYKPNLAFFESQGVKGWVALEETVKYIRANYPDQFIIADAKRGDIGNTSALYARAAFEHLGAEDIILIIVQQLHGFQHLSVTPTLQKFPGKTLKWMEFTEPVSTIFR